MPSWLYNLSFMHTEDTIVAISTAAGSGRRAIVRLSGPEAIDIAQKFFACEAGELAGLGGFCSKSGMVKTFGIALPARAYVFRSPRSFTRQDVVELHIPGSPVAASVLCSSIIEAGARQAGPGEFTARAFFSGRLDLSAAEAVADVIDAADYTQLRLAGAALGGSIAKLCGGASGEIADLLALVEASIDLAEEDIELDSPHRVSQKLLEIAQRLSNLAVQATDMPEQFHQPTVVLCGRPNVGKSSLLNTLSDSGRAIVSDIAGTTRDVLSSIFVLGQAGAVLLQDAAGLTAEPDSLASAANHAAEKAIAAADIILLVADMPAQLKEDQASLDILGRIKTLNRRAVLMLLANKADLLGKDDRSKASEILRDKTQLEPLEISAVTGEGIEKLKLTLAEHLNLKACRSGQGLGLHLRQKKCFIAASLACSIAAQRVGNCCELADEAELVAIELREALAQLGGISGQVVTEDILGRIFARFCVGK